MSKSSFARYGWVIQQDRKIQQEKLQMLLKIVKYEQSPFFNFRGRLYVNDDVEDFVSESRRPLWGKLIVEVNVQQLLESYNNVHNRLTCQQKKFQLAKHKPTFIKLNPNKPGKIQMVWDGAVKSYEICKPDLVTTKIGILVFVPTNIIIIFVMFVIIFVKN